jgi:hypothetical protein
MRVIVVTGGTQVDWDDMRTLTNKSKGRFGCTIANSYNNLGHDVTLIHSESVIDSWVSRGIQDRRSFRTYDDLYKELKNLSEKRFDIIVMAAAISDYAFDKVSGKVSSSEESITVTLKRTDKMLSKLRGWYSSFRPFIIGFKLLSGSTKSELHSVAYIQNGKCNIDLTLANDWLELRKDKSKHPCYFVTPEGGFIRQDGTKMEVADRLAKFSIKRRDVSWGRTRSDNLQVSADHLESRENAMDLLKFGQSFGLFDETINGSVTQRVYGEESMWATPRSISKNLVKKEDFIYVTNNGSPNEVLYAGAVKPEIDSVIHMDLYKALPELSCILHFHGDGVKPDCTTKFPYPCGTHEVGTEILNSIGWKMSESIMVELINHGYLILLKKGPSELWNSMSKVIELAGAARDLKDSKLAPLFVGPKVGGLIIEKNNKKELFFDKEHEHLAKDLRFSDLTL